MNFINYYSNENPDEFTLPSKEVIISNILDTDFTDLDNPNHPLYAMFPSFLQFIRQKVSCPNLSPSDPLQVFNINDYIDDTDRSISSIYEKFQGRPLIHRSFPEDQFINELQENPQGSKSPTSRKDEKK